MHITVHKTVCLLAVFGNVCVVTSQNIHECCGVLMVSPRTRTKQPTWLLWFCMTQKALSNLPHRVQSSSTQQSEMPWQVLMLEALLDCSRDGYMLFDRTGTCLALNTTAAQIYHTHESLLVGATLRDADPRLAQTLSPCMAEVFETGRETHKLELGGELPGHPGRFRHWLSRFVPLSRENNETSHVLVMSTEVSSEHERELERRTFVEVAGHELRTPVTTLRAYLGMLRQELKHPRASGVAVECVHKMDTTLVELTTLMAELLDSSRMDANGRPRVHRRRIDLAHHVRNIVEQTRTVLPTRRVLLRTPHALFVRGDPYRLAHVFDNLLSNALKYSEPDTAVYVSVSKTKEQAVVRVRDSGIGISKANVDKIFGKFYRIHGHERVGMTGLGLGLFIAKQVIETHGGTIEVESVPLEGSTFTVRLPLEKIAPRKRGGTIQRTVSARERLRRKS